MREDLLNIEIIKQGKDCCYYQYEKGKDVSIVCFNYSLPYGQILSEELHKKNISPSLFSVNSYQEFDYMHIIDDILATKNLIVIDDTKSKNSSSDKFLKNVYSNCELDQSIILNRKFKTLKFFH